MSWNTFGRVLRFTTWGESHGPAIGAVVDGCPPGLALSEADIQPFLDARKPGQNKYTTQRQEADLVRILSGTFEGKTTGTPIALMIENTDQRSKDYSEIANTYRPGHADYAYDAKYGFRDYRGGGRSSARETAMPSIRRSSMRRKSSGTPSGAPMPQPRSAGKAKWTRRVNPAPRSARWLNAWRRAFPPDGAHRSTPSSMPTSPQE